jgi:hypothetical protein
LVAANAACGSTYQELLTCGATKPADSWTCYTSTLLSIDTPVPPSSAAPDGCATEYAAFLATVLANIVTCGPALGG